jgi:hypothetical protein
MFSYFRKSRQHSPEQPAALGDETVDAGDASNNVASPNNSHNNSTNKDGNPSASSPSDPSQSPRAVHDDNSPSPHPRMSRESEGYPSWLPKRPPPPPPGSTFHSSMGLPNFDFEQEFGIIRNRELRDAELTDTGAEGSSSVPFFGGRKPTPRSVRIVSLQDSPSGGGAVDGGKRIPSGQSHRHIYPDDFTTPSSGHAGVLPEMRVLTRAGGAGISAAAQTAASSNTPHPRFNARGLHLQIFRSPSKLARIYFYLYPLLVFANVPLQTFFDLNAVYIFVQ